jgi:hypothetical protein
MSEEEIYAAQGRAHANLKKLKSETATIRAEIQRRNQALTETGRNIERCLRDPAHQEVRTPVALHVQLEHDLRLAPEINLGKLADLIEDFAKKTEEIKTLEEQISQF